MGIALSTAGVEIGWAVGTSTTTVPSTFTRLKDVKSTPDFNVEPNGIDVTTLSETTAKQYVEGLRDYGSSISFNANLTTELIAEWAKFVEDAETAKASSYPSYIAIKHPDLANAFVLPCEPIALGLPAMEVDSALETSVMVTPSGGGSWIAKTSVTMQDYSAG